MIPKFRHLFRQSRPLLTVALLAMALSVALLAVASAWAVGAIGDHRVFGPAIFGGEPDEPGTPQATATPTATGQPASTATATATGQPGSTPTMTATATATTDATSTGTTTPTHTPTASPTDTPTATPTDTPTATLTNTPTATATTMATATRTPKPTKTPKASPTPSRTPTPTATPAPGEELLVFDWNRLVTVDDHGFPWDKPPLASANIDWTQPINFAAGTLYFRVEIFHQPVPQDMKLIFCFWQDNNALENCTHVQPVSGATGTVVTWSEPVKQLYKKDGQSIDWSRPRARNGVSIKNSAGDPVSDYSGYAWSGENPNEWYPLDWRFTVVVAEKGAGFSGWDNYID